MAMEFVRRTDFFEIWRRRNAYIFVAPRFGVVMRAKDLSTGMHEVELRIASVAEELKEAGVKRHDNGVDSRTPLRNVTFPTLLAAVVVAALAVGLSSLKLPGHTVA